MTAINRKQLTPIKTQSETTRNQDDTAAAPGQASPATPGLVSDVSSLPSSAAFSSSSRQASWGYDEEGSIDVPRSMKVLRHKQSTDHLDIDHLLDSLQISPLPAESISQHKTRINERIGQGTHANVYRGTLNGALVAIKVANSKASEAYIEREAKVLDYICDCTDALDNIIEHYHGVSMNGKQTLYMELGESDLLDHVMHQVKHNPALTGPVLGIHGWLDTSLMICSGLAALHAIGIVHGDIKPQNVMLCHGVAKLIDFEGAFTPNDDILSRKQQSGHDIMGSNIYAAPELLRRSLNASQSFCTDIFALGVTLLVLATGQEPYADARNGIELIIQCQAGDPIRFTRHTERINKDIERIVRGCCAKVPTERWTIEQVRQSLLDMKVEM